MRLKTVYVVLATLRLIHPPPSFAQSTTTTAKFEAATIKLTTDCEGRTSRVSPGRLGLRCYNLENLILRAYGSFANGRMNPLWAIPKVVGGPSWIRSVNYDINAEAESGASRDLMSGPMLQNLLEDRFKLKIHRETRDSPVYALTVAKSGSKLKPSKEGSCVEDATVMPRAVRPGVLVPGTLTDSMGVQAQVCFATNVGVFGANSRTIEARGADLKMIGWLLGNSLDRPVIDRTGLMGKFDVRVEFVPAAKLEDPSGTGIDPPANVSSIFTAVQQELGLKLEPSRGPVEILVVDQAEKPSEN